VNNLLKLQFKDFVTMNSIKIEPKVEIDGNNDCQSSPTQNDRFSRRLNKYRGHQSDCQTKSDFSFREMCEQESLQVIKLQSQPPKERKVKKAIRRNYKKNDVSCSRLMI
jgi:MamL-1 domain